ncbi:MAG: hypothetical protein J6U23_14875 [Clostridiales bacterium]|nr:hypothetical protein [Clostridiales bacterium]
MNRDITIKNIDLDYKVPASKSVLHRELIISFLLYVLSKKDDPDLTDKLTTPLSSDNKDIEATKACIKALLESEGGDIIMNCNESGSTLRFMISVGAAYLYHKGIDGRLIFLPKGKLMDRPIDQLEECLLRHGISIEKDRDNGQLIVSGKLTEGVFDIEGNISSQYISGLLMASILLPESKVRLIGDLESKGYFELTIGTLESKGVNVDEDDNLYSVKVPSTDKISLDLDVEGDWSSAAFLLSLGALCKNGKMTLHGLNQRSFQKDKFILYILAEMGIILDFSNDSITITERRRSAGRLILDARDYPDIVPYVAVLAAAFKDGTQIMNVERLKFKECDRVEATIEALRGVGASCEYRDGSLFVDGGIRERDKNEPFKTYGDHRMAQTACLIAAWTGKTINIDNDECISKSFPGLWELLEGTEVEAK